MIWFGFQVGGPFSSAAIPQMKAFGRIAVCGGISLYNDTIPQTGLVNVSCGSFEGVLNDLYTIESTPQYKQYENCLVTISET